MTGPVAFRLKSPTGEAWDFLPDEPALTTISGPAVRALRRGLATGGRVCDDASWRRTGRFGRAVPRPDLRLSQRFDSDGDVCRVRMARTTVCRRHGLTRWEEPEGSGLCREEVIFFDAPKRSPACQHDHPTSSSRGNADRRHQRPTPKIELHVHLEGALRPKDLLEIAARNGIGLPADNEADLARLYRFRDFDHFIELWMMTTSAIRTERDFRHVVVSYAEEATSHGAVYIEGIFTPAERISGGASWDEVFSGFCDGAAEAKERFGLEVRLTPDIPRTFGLDDSHGDGPLRGQVPRPRRRGTRPRRPRGRLSA